MKKPISLGIIFFAVFTFAVSAQDAAPAQKESKTKLEAFEAKTGTVLIKGIQEIGSVEGSGAVTVECREFTDANTGHKEYGIIIEVKESARFERKSKSLIDYDEIDSLLKGIDYISKVNKSVTQLTSFEAVYKTKGDLSVTTFNTDRDEMRAAIQSGRIGSATAFFSPDQLTKFRVLIENAKVKLDAVKK